MGIFTFKIWDFEKLTVRPEALENQSSSLHIFGREVIGDVMKSNRSSANHVHLCVCGPHDTPLISASVRMPISKVSMAIANIRGDREATLSGTSGYFYSVRVITLHSYSHYWVRI